MTAIPDPEFPVTIRLNKDSHVVGTIMSALGFFENGTGGGCTTWQRDHEDGKTELWISCDGVSTGGDPDKQHWLVSRRGASGGYIELTEQFTLLGAVDAVMRLPSPIRSDGSAIEETFDEDIAAVCEIVGRE